MLYDQVLTFSTAVQFEDIDLGGGVHNPNYLKYFERARNFHLKSLGISTTELLNNKIAFVLTESYLKFKKPLILEQEFCIYTKMTALKKIGFKIEQYILPKDIIASDSYEELFKKSYIQCVSKLVCVDLERKRATSVPEKYLNIFLNNHQLDKVNEHINIAL